MTRQTRLLNAKVLIVIKYLSDESTNIFTKQKSDIFFLKKIS